MTGNDTGAPMDEVGAPDAQDSQRVSSVSDHDLSSLHAAVVEEQNAKLDTNRRFTVDEALTDVPKDTEWRSQLNQIGYVERFIDAFEEQLLYVPGLGWHIFRDHVWQLDEVNDAFAATVVVPQIVNTEYGASLTGLGLTKAKFQVILASASKESTRQSVLRAAAADRRMKVHVAQLNSDPWTLAVRNGVLDLRHRSIRDGLAQDYITQQADVHFDADARCPLWESHVRTITQRADGTPDPAMYAYLQRWAGYTLTGLVDEQRFPFLWGDGNNGKNVFTETLLALLGTYAARGSVKLLTGSSSEHETGIADLAGLRMCYIDETPKGTVNDRRVKELTGSKEIRARKMRKDYFTFTAKFKLWISGNNRPAVKDTTDGYWRRLDLIPFEYEIPSDKRVGNFGEQLLAERPGILNWCLDGLDAYQEMGLLAPDRVTVAGKTYRDEQNTFKQFVDVAFDRTQPAVWTPNKVLHGMYRAWCEAEGVKPADILSMPQLRDDLKREGFQPCKTQTRIKWGWLDGTRPERGWFGPAPVAVPRELDWSGKVDHLVPDLDG